MKTLLMFLLPAFLFASLISSDFNKVTRSNFIYSTSFAQDDTLEDNPVTAGPMDASGMFNERGFYSSNSASINENEVISNFNGNLQYSIPLYSLKGAGDLNINLSLNYNGSISHKVVAEKTFSLVTGSFHMYNVNAPNWIISLNGYALQMLNFESNFFTHPGSTSSSSVSGKQVRLLASGYHLSDELRGYDVGHEATIFVMKGDGSIVTLKRLGSQALTCDSEDLYANCYIGEFYSEDKQSYTRAKLEFMETDNFYMPSYRNRRMYLMEGDGITYIFEEQKPEYLDYPVNSGYAQKRPQNFLLVKIQDRFGREIKINYNTGVKGRALVQNITTNYDANSIGFDFYNYGSFSTQNFRVSGPGGQYKMWLDEPVSIGTDAYAHRTGITKILNPVQDIINIGYNAYTRIADSLYNPIGPGNFMKCTLQVKRMDEFINYNGGKYVYTYLDQSSGTLQLNFSPGEGNKIRSSSTSLYKGSGRDAFFTNMVDLIQYYNQGNLTKEVDYSYDYNFHSRADVFTKLIDINDIYTTTKRIEAENHPSGDVTPDEYSTTWYYRQYPINATQSEEMPPDFEGHTKLEKEISFTDNAAAPFKQVEYYFEKVFSSNGIYFNSSFLDTGIVETMYPASGGPVSKRTSFRFNYASAPISDNYRNNPITKKTDIDAFFNKTETFNKIIYEDNYYYPDGIYYPSEPNQRDTSRLYIINMPELVKRVNSSGTVLARNYNVYASDNNNVNGYLGQLLSQRMYTPDSTDFKETKYYYNKKDTVGMHLYGEQYKPPTEGSLRMTEDPRGNKTKHYYHNIFMSQNNINGDYNFETEALENVGRVSYRKVLTDNSFVKDSSGSWIDLRLPVRTDSYVNTNYFITAYSNYNAAGIPDEQINYNNFYNYFRFDGINRINQAVLPYDFTIEVPGEFVDTTYVDTTFIIDGRQISTYEFEDNLRKMYFEFDNNCSLNMQSVYGEIGNFWLRKIHPGGNPDNPPVTATDWRPFFAFYEPETLDSLVTIDNATLYLYPSSFYRKTDNDTNINLLQLNLSTLTSYNAGSTFRLSGLSKNIFVDAPMNDICLNATDKTKRFEQSINVTDLLNQHIIEDDSVFMGFMLNSGYVDENYTEAPEIEYILKFGSKVNLPGDTCSIPLQDFCYNYMPKLVINGRMRKIKRYNIFEYSKPTLKNTYDDAKNLVTSETKIAQTDMYKKVQNEFDGFYRLNKTRMYKTSNTFDSTQIKYNYLDQKYETIDGRNNSTKFSYNEFLNVKRTLNADNSEKLDTVFFRNGYNYTFGTIPGLVTFQRFTDETDRTYYKIFDAVGNLRREIRYAESPIPETAFADSLITDYKLDDLYRVIEVKTPANKRIYYSYDGFGRQSTRTTPDAGTVAYKYDDNDNLTYSQDENQDNSAHNIYTFRTYDGLNRPVAIGITEPREGDGNPGNFDNLDGNVPFNYQGDVIATATLVTYNVYDTAINNDVGLFSSPPSDYYSKMNNTRGALVATAYRTLKPDNWNYKWYRYDARGRVIKMWNVIDGFDTKVVEYVYNSSNQVIYTKYQQSGSDFKLTRNMLDPAGRLMDVDLWTYAGLPDTNHSEDNPVNWTNLTSFAYNQNSQISDQSYQLNSYRTLFKYNYNSRNWITQYYNEVRSEEGNPPRFFAYDLQYQTNGNISNQILHGIYKDVFDGKDSLNISYTYDLSNRLLNTTTSSPAGGAFNMENLYDFDGNITKLERHGSDGNIDDDFAYSYTSGTNRLTKVSGSTTQFTYDYNGNMITDSLNNNDNIEYDHRNLITRITREIPGSLFEPPQTYVTLYKYDDAGNRIRKAVLLYVGTPMEPIGGDIDSPPTGWTYVRNEVYIRGVDGNVMAEYNSYDLEQYNLYAGADNFGKMDIDGVVNYYIKDHLGSIRAVIDKDKTIISAQDYDAWGYLLEDRQYNSESSEYKFTSKERDNESNYDYFGARYYDSRIGRWGQTEPLIDKYISWSPYSYSLNNPIVLSDFNGNDAKVTIDGNNITIKIDIYYVPAEVNADYGLNTNQLNALNSFESNIENYWTSDNVKIDDQTYNIKTEVNIIPVGSLSELNKYLNPVNELVGSNVAVNNPGTYISPYEDSGVGVYRNQLVFAADPKPFKDTGAHEAGHLLGLPDRGSLGWSIMHYKKDENSYRAKPSERDFKEVLKDKNPQIDFSSKSEQVLRSTKK